MKPADLVAHLTANLPAAWTVCALPKPLRRRAYGACLVLGDCRIYVAATRSAVDVLATDTTGIDFTRFSAPPNILLGLVRNAAASLALDPATAPEWAKVTT